MSDPNDFTAERPDIPEFQDKKIGRARSALMRRLLDVVAMPGSRLAPQDRAMAGDILLDMLFECSIEDRALCAERLKDKREAPRRLLRYLAQCEISISKPLLQDNEAFDASDLCHLIDETKLEHHLLIARRKTVAVTVAEKLAEVGEPQVMRELLLNNGAVISESCLDLMIHESRTHEDLCALIAERSELKPSQAMAMFWWSDGPTRALMLNRHAADRLEIINICADVFPTMAEEKWADPVARKAMQMIERRQRNRAAIERSPFSSLESAISSAALEGISAKLAQEIGYLSGVKPVTIAKILSDKGGEGLAVLCKATGLKRQYLRDLWVALKRPLEIAEGEEHPLFRHVSMTYEQLSVAKAQTTLRYWNWGLAASFSPKRSVRDAMSDSETGDHDRFSASKRTARLVFGKD